MFAGKRIHTDRMMRKMAMVRAHLATRPQGERHFFVSYRPIALAMLAAKGHDVTSAWDKAWGDVVSVAGFIRRTLGVELEKIDMGPITAGVVPKCWFGAMRGLDHLKDFDGMVTLGDPIANVGGYARQAEMIGESSTWATKKSVQDARDELAQTHGRLRIIHRTKVAVMLHLGRLRPVDWPADTHYVKASEASTPTIDGATMTHADFVRGVEAIRGTGSLRKALEIVADLAHCSLRSAYRYHAGERELPAFVTESVRNELARLTAAREAAAWGWEASP